MRPMSAPQSTLLCGPTPVGRFLTFSLAPGRDPESALARVARLTPGDGFVVGLGEPLVRATGLALLGLRSFPALTGPGVAFPSTQGAVWAFLGGPDAGALLHRARELRRGLGDDFQLDEDVASFSYGGGRDLSGYEDGTENPKDERAVEVALVRAPGAPVDGSSFVAVQRWRHELSSLEAMTPQERDHVIGRSRETNLELADAPASAHVKRTAQESFEPPAFMVRRSMPWGDVAEHGLYFVAYGASLDPFERVLRRMAGLEDGLPDALLRFSRPLTGGYYWCPPLRAGALDLRALRP
jgi:putative iron-dependent peroxidase